MVLIGEKEQSYKWDLTTEHMPINYKILETNQTDEFKFFDEDLGPLTNCIVHADNRLLLQNSKWLLEKIRISSCKFTKDRIYTEYHRSYLLQNLLEHIS